MRYVRTLDAREEAISLSEVRTHCRIDCIDDDDALRVFIESARNYIESLTNNAMVEGSYIFYFDSPELCYEIFSPIVSITSFEYKTTSNTGTYAGSLAGTDYHLDEYQGLITLNDSVATDLYKQSNAVKITATSGRENIGALPGDLKMAMLLMIGHWYENRENSSVVDLKPIPMGAAHLIAPYQYHAL